MRQSWNNDSEHNTQNAIRVIMIIIAVRAVSWVHTSHCFVHRLALPTPHSHHNYCTQPHITIITIANITIIIVIDFISPLIKLATYHHDNYSQLYITIITTCNFIPPQSSASSLPLPSPPSSSSYFPPIYNQFFAANFAASSLLVHFFVPFPTSFTNSITFGSNFPSFLVGVKISRLAS